MDCWTHFCRVSEPSTACGARLMCYAAAPVSTAWRRVVVPFSSERALRRVPCSGSLARSVCWAEGLSMCLVCECPASCSSLRVVRDAVWCSVLPVGCTMTSPVKAGFALPMLLSCTIQDSGVRHAALHHVVCSRFPSADALCVVTGPPRLRLLATNAGVPALTHTSPVHFDCIQPVRG